MKKEILLVLVVIIFIIIVSFIFMIYNDKSENEEFSESLSLDTQDLGMNQVKQINAQASKITEIQLTGGLVSTFHESFYNDIMVLNRIGTLGGSSFYYYDINNRNQDLIAHVPSKKFDILHYGDKIVYSDCVIGGLIAMESCIRYFVVMFDISENTTTILQENKRLDSKTDIYEDLIVWAIKGPGTDYDLYTYNLTSNVETLVIGDMDNQYEPQIYEDKIVYMGNIFNDGTYSLNLYDMTLDQNTKIFESNSRFEILDFFGNKIYYIKGYDFVYEYDITNKVETLLMNSDNKFNQDHNVFEDKILVWRDKTSGQFDIYMMDLETKEITQVTNTPSDEHNPIVYENKIVYYRDSYIYMSVLGGDVNEFYGSVDIMDLIMVSKYFGRDDCGANNNWCDGRDLNKN